MATREPPDLDLVREILLVPESTSVRDIARSLEQGFLTDPPEALPPGPECEAVSRRLLTPIQPSA